MTINETIKKAVEGGYNGYLKPFCQECGGYETPNISCGGSMFLDPQFWQCLGKAMGWKLKFDSNQVYTFGDKLIDEWRYRWFCFIDHLAEGGTLESFFKNL